MVVFVLFERKSEDQKAKRKDVKISESRLQMVQSAWESTPCFYKWAEKKRREQDEVRRPVNSDVIL